jgi:hypothetical protein
MCLSTGIDHVTGMSVARVLEAHNARTFMELLEVTSVYTKLWSNETGVMYTLYLLMKPRFCQDQLALAYVSGKPIYPVALAPRKELMENMDNGM